MTGLLVTALWGCGPVVMPRECEAEWEPRDASSVFVVEHGGRGLLVAVEDGGARWDWLAEDLSMRLAGEAPFADTGTSVLGAIPTGPADAPALLLVGEGSVYTVVDGEDDAVRAAVHMGDGAEHRGLQLTAAWPAGDVAWVAFTEDVSDYGLSVWSAGIGTVDAEGLLTPVASGLYEREGALEWPKGLVGGRDPETGTLWVTSGDYEDTVWTVTEAGVVAEGGTLPDGLYGGPGWVTLPGGRWAWRTLRGLAIWDPLGTVTWVQAGPAWVSGTLYSTGPTGIVAVTHEGGELTAQSWDGEAAGEPVVTPYTFEACDRTEESWDPQLAKSRRRGAASTW